MPAPSDLVHETSTTTGTGDFTLSNANGKRSFNTAFGTGGSNVFDYYISNTGAAEWERGTGHLSAASTLVRDTVKASSNSNNAVNFSAGTKDVTNDVPAARQVYTDESNNITPPIASLNGGPLAGFRNHLLNGAMMVAQRGTSFTSTTEPANSDDQYLLDQWILLVEGADAVDVTQSTEVPTGGLYSIALDVETANLKFGIFQPIEQKNCIGLIGNTVTLSAYLKVSNARIDDVRMAIIAWDGTADTITSDIVSVWETDATNPTLVANWTYENTPADLGVTTSWARYSVTAVVDTASAKNIGVFIWSNTTVADPDVGDFLYITDVQLEIGSAATPFERRPYGVELLNCQRYFQDLGRGVVSNTLAPFYTQRAGANIIDCPIKFTPPLRTAPALVTSSPGWAGGAPTTTDNINNYNNVASAYTTIVGALTLSLQGSSFAGAVFRMAAGTSFSGTSGDVGNLYVGSVAWLSVTAEL